MINEILAFVHGHYIIFDDDDEINETLEKVDNFAEETVPRYSDKQFKIHFRMSPGTFEAFLQQMHSVRINTPSAGHPEMNLEKQALMTLWCLSNMESFR